MTKQQYPLIVTKVVTGYHAPGIIIEATEQGDDHDITGVEYTRVMEGVPYREGRISTERFITLINMKLITFQFKSSTISVLRIPTTQDQLD